MAWWDDLDLGIKVERPAGAVDSVVAPGDPYFTIAGGMVVLTGLIGICTIAPGGAVDLSWGFDPAIGAGANVLLCTNTTCTTAVVDDIITITGASGDALINAHLASNPMMEAAPRGVALSPGVLGLIGTAVQGTFRWILWYRPAEVDATIVIVP